MGLKNALFFLTVAITASLALGHSNVDFDISAYNESVHNESYDKDEKGFYPADSLLVENGLEGSLSESKDMFNQEKPPEGVTPDGYVEPRFRLKASLGIPLFKTKLLVLGRALYHWPWSQNYYSYQYTRTLGGWFLLSPSIEGEFLFRHKHRPLWPTATTSFFFSASYLGYSRKYLTDTSFMALRSRAIVFLAGPRANVPFSNDFRISIGAALGGEIHLGSRLTANSPANIDAAVRAKPTTGFILGMNFKRYFVEYKIFFATRIHSRPNLTIKNKAQHFLSLGYRFID